MTDLEDTASIEETRRESQDALQPGLDPLSLGSSGKMDLGVDFNFSEWEYRHEWCSGKVKKKLDYGPFT